MESVIETKRVGRLMRLRAFIADIPAGADMWLICGGLAVVLFLSWLL